MSFYRSIGTNYTQNKTNSTIGRYISMNFIYNLRYFGSNKKRGVTVYDIDSLPTNL